jgi:hypothetical protein
MDRIEPARLLWIAAEDDLTAVGRAAKADGFALAHAAGVPEAMEHLKHSRIDAVVVCLPIPEYTAAEALEVLQRVDGSVPILWDHPYLALRAPYAGSISASGAEAEPAHLAGAKREGIDERRSRVSTGPDTDEAWRLENTVKSAIILSLDGPGPLPVTRRANFVQIPGGGLDLEPTCSQAACAIIEEALLKTNENKKILADLLRPNRTTMAAKLRNLVTSDPETVLDGKPRPDFPSRDEQHLTAAAGACGAQHRPPIARPPAP